MKILYLLNTYPRPSHSFVRREIRALERLGHEVRRVAMRGVPDQLVDPEDVAEQALTEHVLRGGAARRLASALLRQALSAPAPTWRALRLALAAARLSERGLAAHLAYAAEAAHVARICRAEGIDHVHAHFGTNAATVAMLAQALGGPGYSFTVHGPEEFDAPRALMLGEKMRRAAFTVAISSYGRSQLCRWADPADWPRIRVVHCGIEPAGFAAPAPVPEGPATVVAIGRFVEQKGQLVLVEAMARLKARAPGLRLVLVGDGEMRGAVETAIRAQGLEDRVTLAGWLDEAGVRKALAEARALVMPSFAEGLPMVVMEAMAAERPVIATFVAGMPELVQAGRTGWLVPAGDADALAEALAELAETPVARLREMGAEGRGRALERHDVDREAAKLAELMAEAVRRGRARGAERVPGVALEAG